MFFLASERSGFWVWKLWRVRRLVRSVDGPLQHLLGDAVLPQQVVVQPLLGGVGVAAVRTGERFRRLRVYFPVKKMDGFKEFFLELWTDGQGPILKA
jgi:hypothetical protein